MTISSRVLSAAIGFALVPGLALVDARPAEAISSSAKTSFISSIVSAAQAAQRKFGVPTSASIAQAIVASDWGTSAAADDANNYFDTPCSGSMTAAQYADLADAQVGKPYVLGANGPNQFDCSSLVIWVNNQSGAFRMGDDTAAGMYNRSRAVSGSPKVGDMVFLRNNPARSNGIGHMAVVTQKLSNGDWRIIEARGRAYGVVRSTLSYWKQRSYYAGLRRLAKITFSNSDAVTTSAARLYQSGCVKVGSTSYANFTSMTNSFYANAAAITGDAGYKSARSVINNIPKYVDAIAKVERPKDAAAYAATIKSLIATYNLADYEVVPFTIVLESGDKGPKVTALQHLLLARGGSVRTTGAYDSPTVSAVRKYQSAKGLTVDGEAGPKTLSALFATLKSGATGVRVNALHAMLAALGYQTTAGSTFGAETLASVKAFQTAAGRSGSGIVDSNTWAQLYMSLEPAPAPTVTGTARVTQKLTAAPGKWGPGSVALAYQWYRNGKPITAATTLSYTLQPDDAGAAITISATGTRAGYTTVSRFSKATAPVAKALLAVTPTPKITGTTTVGQTLSAVAGDWSPAPVVAAYQWYRGTTAITGATNTTYTLQAADAGQKIKVTVTGSKAGYETVAKTSTGTAAVAKGSLSATPTPKTTGTAIVGETLTAVPGTWAPEPVELSYQWYRGSAVIPGATRSTYILQNADAKATIKVKVTGTKAGYDSVSKTSAATGKVAQPGLLDTATPKISGTAKVGKTLKATAGSWGPGTVKLNYRWYRAGKAISGATKTSYTLKSADRGHTITVHVAGRKSGYNTVSMKSAGVRVK